MSRDTDTHADGSLVATSLSLSLPASVSLSMHSSIAIPLSHSDEPMNHCECSGTASRLPGNRNERRGETERERERGVRGEPEISCSLLRKSSASRTGLTGLPSGYCGFSLSLSRVIHCHACKCRRMQAGEAGGTVAGTREQSCASHAVAAGKRTNKKEPSASATATHTLTHSPGFRTHRFTCCCSSTPCRSPCELFACHLSLPPT